MVSSSVDERTVEENAVWVVIEAFKVEVSASVEVETSLDLELTLQGLALELDMKQAATKAATSVLEAIVRERNESENECN